MIPYLIVEGVAKLIAFLKFAFEAKETERHANPDGTIMHSEVRIGDSIIMMGEPTGEFKLMPGSIYLYVNDTDAVYKRALQAGGTSIMEPADRWDANERGDTGDQRAGVRDVTARTDRVSRRSTTRLRLFESIDS